MFGAPGVDVDTNWGEMGGASRQDSAWFGMGGPGLAGQDENAENGTHFGGLLHYTQGLDADANTPGHNEMALSTYPPVVRHAVARELCCRI